MSSTKQFKVRCQGKIHVISSNAVSNFSEFKREVLKRFAIDEHYLQFLAFTYLDEDNDIIELANDDDFDNVRQMEKKTVIEVKVNQELVAKYNQSKQKKMVTTVNKIGSEKDESKSKEIKKVYEFYKKEEISNKKEINNGVVKEDGNNKQKEVDVNANVNMKNVNVKNNEQQQQLHQNINDVFDVNQVYLQHNELQKEACVQPQQQQQQQHMKVNSQPQIQQNLPHVNIPVIQQQQQNLFMRQPIIQPIQQIHPIQPIQQIHPIQPMQPIQPVHPIQPIKPIQPIHHSQHIQPIQPIQPQNPFIPINQQNKIEPIENINNSIQNNNNTEIFFEVGCKECSSYPLYNLIFKCPKCKFYLCRKCEPSFSAKHPHAIISIRTLTDFQNAEGVFYKNNNNNNNNIH